MSSLGHKNIFSVAQKNLAHPGGSGRCKIRLENSIFWCAMYNGLHVSVTAPKWKSAILMLFVTKFGTTLVHKKPLAMPFFVPKFKMFAKICQKVFCKFLNFEFLHRGKIFSSKSGFIRPKSHVSRIFSEIFKSLPATVRSENGQKLMSPYPIFLVFSMWAHIVFWRWKF